MKNNSERNGAKVGATAIIWSLATGIMAICIPLVKISQTGVVLPLAVITGVSISTVAVWLSGNYKAVKLSDNFQKIEQRVRDLEAISGIEELDLKRKIKQLEK